MVSLWIVKQQVVASAVTQPIRHCHVLMSQHCDTVFSWELSSMQNSTVL